MTKALVTGAGGFIGGYLVGNLLAKGQEVVAVDKKPYDEWFQRWPQSKMAKVDLADAGAAYPLLEDVDDVYNFASNMGGMGFIEKNKALCMLSVLINTHMLIASEDCDVKRYFYSSSACVYAADKQNDTNVTALKESDAYPAMPEDGYGWEKLFSEHMCRHFREDFGFPTWVGRFHNVYGPHSEYVGGREKAPAAICRKVIEAKLTGAHEIEVWGDGEQTRSFMYIDDCIEGVNRLVDSDVYTPINIGSSELVTVNQLIDIVEDIAEIKVLRVHDLSAPQGVRGRNSDNTMIKERLGWEPSTPLRVGMENTYSWIYDMMKKM